MEGIRWRRPCLLRMRVCGGDWERGLAGFRFGYSDLGLVGLVLCLGVLLMYLFDA